MPKLSEPKKKEKLIRVDPDSMDALRTTLLRDLGYSFRRKGSFTEVFKGQKLAGTLRIQKGKFFEVKPIDPKFGEAIEKLTLVRPFVTLKDHLVQQSLTDMLSTHYGYSAVMIGNSDLMAVYKNKKLAGTIKGIKGGKFYEIRPIDPKLGEAIEELILAKPVLTVNYDNYVFINMFLTHHYGYSIVLSSNGPFMTIDRKQKLAGTIKGIQGGKFFEIRSIDPKLRKLIEGLILARPITLDRKTIASIWPSLVKDYGYSLLNTSWPSPFREVNDKTQKLAGTIKRTQGGKFYEIRPIDETFRRRILTKLGKFRKSVPMKL